MSTRKSKIISILKKSGIALGMTALFTLFSIFPGLGYYGEASTSIFEMGAWGFWTVEAQVNASFNPLLFPYSWISGKGDLHNATFRFISVPTYSAWTNSYVWRGTEELNEDAMIIILLNHLIPNILPNFFILLAIALTDQKILYLCLFGGIVGFLFGSIVGSVLGLVVMVFLTYYVMPKFKVFEFLYRYL